MSQRNERCAKSITTPYFSISGFHTAATCYWDDATGETDKIVSAGTLDLSKIDLVLPEGGEAPAATKRFRIVDGTTTGAFKSVANLPRMWEIVYNSMGASVRRAMGMTIIIR